MEMEIMRAKILTPLLAWFFSILLLMMATAAAETVKVSTTPIFPDIPRGQARKDFQVLLRVEAPAHPMVRAPIDVVAVLDVSGSMNSPAAPLPEKRTSRLDLVKAAAKFVVVKLDDADRVSILAFNDRPVKELSSVLLHMSGDGRKSAMKYVDQLQARGGTSLMPALEEAVKILDGRHGDGRSRLGFIIVLTDGEDRSASAAWRERHRENLRSALSRYPVHAIGLGTAHDPEALLYVAQESHGSYSYVDVENIDKIRGALAIVLGGLTTIAAADTRIVIKAAGDLINGVRIDRIDSGGHGSRVSCGGTSCEVAVGVLYAGSVKHFVVHLRVPALSSSSMEGVCDQYHYHRHEQHLLTIGYSYRHHPGTAAIAVEGHDVLVERTPEVGGGRQAAVPPPSPVVLQHMVRFELVEALAGLVLDEVMVKDTARAGEVLQLRWEEFRACHQFWGGLDLSGLEEEVDALVSSLRSTGMASYVYAWVSSHQMQQATSMGSPEKVVAEFLTPSMRLMLEEAETTAVASVVVQVQQRRERGRGCVAMEVIDRRLELWSKVKSDVQHLMFQPLSAGGGEDHLAAVFHEASLEAIDRAMHRDIYLAAVYASKQRRCDSGARENSELD